jgi:hypothetical protein
MGIASVQVIILHSMPDLQASRKSDSFFGYSLLFNMVVPTDHLRSLLAGLTSHTAASTRVTSHPSLYQTSTIPNAATTANTSTADTLKAPAAFGSSAGRIFSTLFGTSLPPIPGSIAGTVASKFLSILPL